MRRIIDTYPVITLTIGTTGNAYTARAMTRPQAEQALAEALDSLRTAFKRVPIYHIGKALGQTVASTTERYAKLAPDDISGVFDTVRRK